MKQLIHITTCILFIWLLSIISCKKDSFSSHQPIASAGEDILIELPACDDKGSAELDGSGSSDPDHNIVLFQWTLVSGPATFTIANSGSSKTRIENMPAGEYVFELKVTDVTGLKSEDRVTVRVKGPTTEYDLDISFAATYNFVDDYADCYYYYNCSYYDLLGIQGKGQFLPLGEFDISVSEYSDMNDNSDIHNTIIDLSSYQSNVNATFTLSGRCSVNFKKLIKRGGGAIDGFFVIINGSALSCDPAVFKNLPALKVTGYVDVNTKTASIRIEGKVYF